MPSNYALASQCQLRRDELQELLALITAAANNHRSDVESDGLNGDVALPLWCAFLTEAHVRSLVMRALVRVSIPKSKQQQLIQGNKYIVTADDSVTSGKQQQQHYRVGSIMGLVPRQRAASSSTTTTDASPSGALLSGWLVEINFGEARELLGAKYLSNESMRVEEHTVFVRSSLAMHTNMPVTLMTAPEADVVVRNLLDIRQFVAEVKAKRNSRAAEEMAGSVSHTPSSVPGTSLRKRLRDNGTSIGEGIEDDGDNDAGQTLTHEQLLAERMMHHEERRQWEILRDEQQRHLSGLRQLLNSKNGEVQRLLLEQRQTEAAHKVEVEQWRAKAEEQGRSIRHTEQALLEEREVQKGHREKTEKLVTQLKKLAEQTRKFKEVSDTVAEWLHAGSKQPEEVLVSLRTKMAGG